MSVKDSRLHIIKNMIHNLCYIKSKGLENFFHAKIYDIRNDELRFMGKLYMWILIAVFTRVLLTSAIWIITLFWILVFNYKVGMDAISI